VTEKKFLNFEKVAYFFFCKTNTNWKEMGEVIQMSQNLITWKSGIELELPP
jgi:hypothetical protein